MTVLSLQDSFSKLAGLMRGFERDAATSRRLIGELLEADPDAFRRAAVEAVKVPDDSRAFRYVITVLVSSGLLMPVLCDPALNRHQVLTAARAARVVDPLADATIARCLADGLIASDRCVQPRHAARLLEILCEISDGSRIVPSLMRLLRHPDPHLRSKAVKLIGRGNHSAKWVRNRLAETDPRVRANAIESLWDVDTAEARELLQACVHDGDNRVAGNALVALHRIGDCGAIPEFFRMAALDSPRFRVTAAWAMGETGDPRFTEILASLLRDAVPAVRKRAMSSLGQIKASLTASRQTSPWFVTGVVQDDPKRNRRRLKLALVSETGEFPVALATQFLVTEEGHPVNSYRFIERPAPPAMSVSFVFPRSTSPSAEPWIRGALSCRPWKRTSDLWSLQPYLPPGEWEHSDSPAEDPFRFTSNLQAMEAALQEIPTRARCAEFWNAVLQAVRPDSGGSRGDCHAIVFNSSTTSLEAPEELLLASLHGSRIQIVSTVPDPLLEAFCHRAGGLFRVAESAEDVPRLIRTCYLSLLARYEIAYAPLSPDCRAIGVRVQIPGGWGETSIPVRGS